MKFYGNLSQASVSITLNYKAFATTLYTYIQHNFIINFLDFNKWFNFFYGTDYIQDSNIKRLQEIQKSALAELAKSRQLLTFEISAPDLIVDANTAESNIKDKIAFIQAFRNYDVILRNTLVRVINEGYVDRDLRIIVDKLNQYLPDNSKLAPIPIDAKTDWGKTLWLIGSFGPWLIANGWLTKQADGTFWATYGDKGLDHTRATIYDPYNGANTTLTITDIVLLEAIISLQPLLKVPDTQINILIELTGHVSGAAWHNRAVNMAETIIAAGIAIYMTGAIAAQLLTSALGPAGAQILTAGSNLYTSITGKQGLNVIQSEMMKPFMQDLQKTVLTAASNSGTTLPNGTIEQYKIVAGSILADNTLSPDLKKKALTLLNGKTGGAIASPETSSSNAPKGSAAQPVSNMKPLLIAGGVIIGGGLALIALKKVFR
jgi:hypothetical protein